MRFDGQRVLITGAASGLGAEIARRFASEGARILMADVNADRLHDVRMQIGGAAHASVRNVTSEADWATLIAEASQRMAGLEVLVNCAGAEAGAQPQDPERLHIEDWRKIHAVNVEGTALGCKYAIGAMRQTGGGAIVNIASVAGCVATPSSATSAT